MSSQRCIAEFKEATVRMVVGRGYVVSGVAERLYVFVHSLYTWVKAVKPGARKNWSLPLIILSFIAMFFLVLDY